MKRLGAFLLVIVLGLTTFAQSGYFAVRTVRKGKDFSFPIFVGFPNKPATKRINQLLQLSELALLTERNSKDPFGSVSIDDGTIYGGKTEISGKIYSNDRQKLSVGFVESSCGMTCAYWHRYYTFNPVNGDRIDLRDLFTPTGFQAFSKRVIGKRSAKFRREVTLRIKLAEREARLGPLGSIEVDKLEDFYIQGNSIFIDGENCLTKNEKFDGIDMYVRFDLREFKRFLNEYGLAVFGIGRPDISKFRSNGLPQLFKGNVNGSSPFIMLIRNFGNGEVNGIYAYLKYGIGIPLLGTLADGKVELTERIMVDTAENPNTGVSHRYIDGGLISGHLSDEIFTGIWTDSAKTRSYQIRASKY